MPKRAEIPQVSKENVRELDYRTISPAQCNASDVSYTYCKVFNDSTFKHQGWTSCTLNFRHDDGVHIMAFVFEYLFYAIDRPWTFKTASPLIDSGPAEFLKTT